MHLIPLKLLLGEFNCLPSRADFVLFRLKMEYGVNVRQTNVGKDKPQMKIYIGSKPSHVYFSNVSG